MLVPEEVIEILNHLLLQEYLQRDVYETYGYYLFGLASPAIQDHLEDHLADENKHIRTLQRYLMALGADPLTERLEVPLLASLSIDSILDLDLKLEQQALNNYSTAISDLEKAGDKSLTALRIDLENILVQEQEHVQDILQWLRTKKYRRHHRR